MRRPHRWAHLLLWLIVFPVGALGLLAALRSAPGDLRSELPETAVTAGGG